MQTSGSPLISAVVAAYNEERHIEACIAGLCAQVDLPGELEIIVVDGNSTDRTAEIVRALAASDGRIRLVPNPDRYQVYAWNIGTRLSRGQYVVFCSAHTEYADDYLARCYEAQQRTGAANVGGVQTPVGDGLIGKAVAIALQSPFGVGNATFRYTKKEQFVDSAFAAFFRKSLLVQVGGYDESIVINEDSELNYRLRAAGHKILVSPSIHVRYHVRSSIPALIRQMFTYGYWRRRTQLEHPRYVPWRVMAPPLLVLGIVLALAGFASTGSAWWLAIPALYAAFVTVAVCAIIIQSGSLLPALCLLFVLPTMHIAYGVGWLSGLLVHRRRGVRGSLHQVTATS